MKWYINRLDELKKAKPIYSICGDDCAVCPRFLAKTDEELKEVAEFWYRVGWRDRVVSNEEIKCNGCGSHPTCSFMLLPCAKEHNVSKCKDCPDFMCEKINYTLEKTDKKMIECRNACENEEEFLMLKRAFYNKRENLNK